jgi:alpha-mannosidase
MQVDAHEGTLPATHSFVDIKAANVVLTAMKKTENGNGLLFRFYEWAGKTGNVTIVVPPGATDATLTDLMERPQGSAIPVTEGKVSVPVHPFEIVSVRVTYPNNNAK